MGNRKLKIGNARLKIGNKQLMIGNNRSKIGTVRLTIGNTMSTRSKASASKHLSFESTDILIKVFQCGKCDLLMAGH